VETSTEIRSVDPSDLRVNKMALAGSYSLSQLADSILDSAIFLMRISAGFIVLVDGEDYGSVIGKRNIKIISGNKIPLRDGALRSVIDDKKTLIVPHLEREPFSRKQFKALKGPALRSGIYMPLLTRDEVIGIIGVYDHIPDAFGMRDLETLSIIANQAAMSLENYILYEDFQSQAEKIEKINREIDQRLSELVTLYEAGKLIGAVLDLDPLMELVVDIAMGITGTDSCVVYLREGQGKLRVRAKKGLDEDEAEALKESLGDPLMRRLSKRKEEKPVLVTGSSRLGKSPRWRRLKFKTSILVPLIIRDEAIGLLNVNQHYRDREFTPNDLRFISTFATQAAMAVKSALLYNEIQEQTSKLERSNFELDRRVSELQTLHEAGKVIGTVLDLRELCGIITDVAMGITGVDSSLILLMNQTTGDLTPEGARGIDEPSLKRVIKAAQGDARVKLMKSDEPLIINPENKGLRTIILAPLRVKGETLGLLALNQHFRKRDFTDGDIRLISTFATQTALAIKNSVLYKEMDDKHRMEQDLESARTIQGSLLPRTLPKVDGLTFGGISRPAREVGGDFYDFIEIDSNRIGVAIGDVAGKSIPASLLMTMARSLIRAECGRHASPKEVIGRVNDLIAQDAVSDRYVTILYLVLDKTSKKLSFTLGGHVPLLLYRKNSDATESIDLNGIPVGLVEGAEYEEKEIALKKGDVVVLYTDGVTEALNQNGEQFGFERLVKAVRTYSSGSGEDIAKGIYHELDTFASGSEQFDDITIVTLKVN